MMWETVLTYVLGAAAFFVCSPVVVLCLAIWWKTMKAAVEEFKE